MKRDDWQRLAAAHPYYVVQTVPELMGAVDEDAHIEFFRSGAAHAEWLWGEIERCVASPFRPSRALDFGCGIGRVAIPMATRCAHITGVDIAAAMIERAIANAAAAGVNNTQFLVDHADLAQVAGDFDFVHSVNVLQHIPPHRGYRIVERLVGALRVGGVGAVHLTYRNALGRSARVRHAAYARWPRLHTLRRRFAVSPGGPALPMYTYDIGKVLDILRKANVHRTTLHFTNEGVDGAMIMFRREQAPTVAGPESSR